MELSKLKLLPLISSISFGALRSPEYGSILAYWYSQTLLPPIILVNSPPVTSSTKLNTASPTAAPPTNAIRLPTPGNNKFSNTIDTASPAIPATVAPSAANVPSMAVSIPDPSAAP